MTTQVTVASFEMTIIFLVHSVFFNLRLLQSLQINMSDHKVIGKNGKEIYSDVLLHPGEILFEKLEAQVISQKDFAISVGMRPPHFNKLLKGKRPISAMLALKLEKKLKIEASFWLRLQVDYDLKIARRQLKVA
jgi:antitoxin HigA-1